MDSQGAKMSAVDVIVVDAVVVVVVVVVIVIRLLIEDRAQSAADVHHAWLP